jgi:hypothetical protein
MSKSILKDITPGPWDLEIVETIEQNRADVVAAIHLPDMVEALKIIADPWQFKSSLLFNDDASVIFELATTARKVLQKMQDEYSKNSPDK